jgi:SCY1-like protein 1
MAAIVVTETLDWKLHGFDLLSEAACQGDFALRQASWMVPQQYKPAEVARSEWETVAAGPPWAVDAWGLGCMIQEVFSGQPLRAVEQLRQTEHIPPALLADYQKLLSSSPGKRLNPAQVRAAGAAGAAARGGGRHPLPTGRAGVGQPPRGAQPLAGAAAGAL